MQAGKTFPSCGGVTNRGRGWSTIALPPFPPHEAAFPTGGGISPQRKALSYAVDPVDSDRLYAGNGAEVFRSDDGGCTWKTVFSLSSNPALVPPCGPYASYVESVAVGPTAASRDRVYAQVVTMSSSWEALWTCLFGSTDGGKSWSLLTDVTSPEGASPALGVGQLLIAPSDPSNLYLTRRIEGLTNTDSLFVSSDAGATWQVVDAG